MASFTNVFNVVLNSKVEQMVEDALLRYLELHTPLIFYWRNCRDAEKNPSLTVLCEASGSCNVFNNCILMSVIIAL